MTLTAQLNLAERIEATWMDYLAVAGTGFNGCDMRFARSVTAFATHAHFGARSMASEAGLQLIL